MEGRGLEQRACLPERDTCKVAGSVRVWGERLGGAGGAAPEPYWLPHPYPTGIPHLSSEIRMSKPLEAEKQGLDSPSEHAGKWGTGQGGQRLPRAEAGARWGF